MKSLHLLFIIPFMVCAHVSFAQWFNLGGNAILTNANGRVGIGTPLPAPGHKLSLQYNSTVLSNHIGLIETGAGDAARISFSNSGTAGNDYWTLQGAAVGSSTATRFHISYDTDNVGSPTNIFSVDGRNQRVGIRNSNPSYTLDVSGDARFSNIRDVYQIQSSTDLEFKIDKNNNSGLFGYFEVFNGANNHLFWVNESGNAYIRGNLGLGANPTTGERLYVNGNVRLDNGDLTFDQAGERFNIDLRANGKMAFEANGTVGNNSLVIDDDGVRGVGFGTDTPTERIHVVGNARIEGNLLFGSAETLSDGGNTTIACNSNFRPSSDNLRDLGTSTFRWDEVWATDGSINTSDARFKKSIKEIPYGMKEIMQLRPVRFTWNREGYEDHPRLGFIAQELLPVLKEVVRTDNYHIDLATGKGEWRPVEKLGVAYSEIIPVLVSGMQEQQRLIEATENENKALKEKLLSMEERLAKLEALLNKGNLMQNAPQNVIIEGANQPRLRQNAPNPFGGQTTIEYYLPNDVTNASLQIADQTGRIIKIVQLDQTGNGKINLTNQDLPNGNYSYSLIINGKIIDTKQMIIMTK
ncbi:MAG: tail fiber domain-containing protein [Saprospiraceae bacterium]